MLSNQNSLQRALTNCAFAAATFVADYTHGQATPEPPAATVPAKDEPVLRRERFSAKYRDEIRKTIATELDTTVVLVFSVPELCQPCKAYEPQLTRLAEILRADASKTKVFVVDFDSFEQAEELTTVPQGAQRIKLAPPVPSTLVIPKLPEAAIATLGERANDGKDQFLPTTLSRAAIRWIGGATADELQEALKRCENFVEQQPTAEGDSKKSVPQVLNASRKWLGFSN